MESSQESRAEERSRLQRWWQGRVVKVRSTEVTEWTERGVNRRGVLLPEFRTQHHWTASLVRALVAFYLRHWQWLWTTLIALAAAVAGFLALKP